MPLASITALREPPSQLAGRLGILPNPPAHLKPLAGRAEKVWQSKVAALQDFWSRCGNTTSFAESATVASPAESMTLFSRRKLLQ
jgi:hypothetical protein